jgi:nicotinamidase-related amidase
MKKFRRQHLLRSAIITWSLSGFICLLVISAFAQTIIDEWNSVKVPPAPELKPVTIDPKVTALLLLDFDKQICNAEKRPRCFASIPKVQKLLTEARAKGVSVIHTTRPGEAAADIAKELAPIAGEPVVSSGPDKFRGTELEKILKDKNVKTVVVMGTTAHGAVLYTASGAALRGIKVIVPVDGMSADSLYPEQYTAWNLVNAPRISTEVTLSRTDMIKF